MCRWLEQTGVDSQYDYIIFDCPPATKVVAQNAIAASHGFILPVVPEAVMERGAPHLDALIALADHLQSLGSLAVKDLEQPRRPKKNAHFLDNDAARKASIDEVKGMLNDGLPKTLLVQLARVRFGMPEARLRRMPTEQVIEAIQAAAAHEESLEIIEKNAELSGRTRSS